jgi:hypothetical protein
MDKLEKDLDEFMQENKENQGLPGYKDLSPEEQNKKLQQLFKNVFSSYEGKIVLTQILEDLCFFKKCRNDDENSLCNYAKYLMANRLGINDNFSIIGKLLNNI